MTGSEGNEWIAKKYDTGIQNGSEIERVQVQVNKLTHLLTTKSDTERANRVIKNNQLKKKTTTEYRLINIYYFHCKAIHIY